MSRRLLTVLLCCLPLLSVAATDEGIPLKKAMIDTHDKAAQWRGAKYYMQYCQSCHSVRFMRYDGLVAGLGVSDTDVEALKKRLEASNQRLNDYMLTPLDPKQAEKAYGHVPPDLTLIARQRGIDWLYTYMTGFYQDLSRPSGVNNLLVPGVSMPNIFQPFQGVQEPVYRQREVMIDGKPQEIKEISHLNVTTPGSMSTREFNQMVLDIIDFLAYTAEPAKASRQRIGVWVIIFLLICGIVAFFLKKEFWKDIH